MFYFTANSTKFFDWQHRGTEELAHLEMVGTIVHQLTKGASIEEIEKAGLSAYYTDHGVGLQYLLILLFNFIIYYFSKSSWIVGFS